MHPSIAFELLSRIPRLESVAAMIAGQQGPPPGKARQQPTANSEPGEVGAHLLKIAVDFDQLLIHGTSAKQALEKLMSQPDEYHPDAVAALETLSTESVPFITREISIREMSTGMILDENLRLANGMLMVARNQEITYPLLVRIRNFCQKSPAPGKIRVKIPQRAASENLEMKGQAVLHPGR